MWPFTELICSIKVIMTSSVAPVPAKTSRILLDLSLVFPLIMQCEFMISGSDSDRFTCELCFGVF